jgi:hypothetical protein
LDDVWLVRRKSELLSVLGLGCVVASASFSTMASAATKAQRPPVKVAKSSKQTPPKLLAPAKPTTKVSLTDAQIGDWSALQLGALISHFPLQRLRLPLTAEQTSCTVKLARPALTGARAAEIAKDPLDYPSDRERRALAGAALSCGFGNEAIFFGIERGERVLLPEVKTCLEKEFGSWPLFGKHLEMEVLHVRFTDDELQTIFEPLTQGQQRIAEICFSEEQKAIFKNRVAKTFNTITNTLPPA